MTYSSNKIDNTTYNPLTGNISCNLTGQVLGKRIKTGYIVAVRNKKGGLVHRLAFDYMGIDITGKPIDHINHDKSDNRFENLRVVTHAENSRNRARVGNRISSTGYTGVVLDKKRPVHQQYRAQVMFNKKQHTIGRYPTSYEAHLAVVEARTRLGFHPNHGKAL